MMIKPVPCPNCGQPKKTRHSQLCHKCANQKNTGHHWTPEELQALKLYYSYKKEADTLKQQMINCKKEMQTQAPKIMQRHSRVAIYYKARTLSYIGGTCK